MKSTSTRTHRAPSARGTKSAGSRPDPQYAAALTPAAQLSIAAIEGRWTGMIAAAVGVERGALQREALLLAFVAGLIWFIIAWQAIQPQEALVFRTVVPLLAVVAGALSTVPTLAVGTWQEEALGLREGGGFYANLFFFVAGVGPREEVIKLLFFVPFVPLLLRRRHELEVLIVAAYVGLGFAAAENLLYFQQAGPVAAYGRFFTANFLHMAATGLVGLAFYRMILQPVRGAAVFAATLVLVTLAHGIYDAFIVARAVRLFAIVSITAFMALSFAFFQQLRARRHGLTDQFSIAGTLVLGLALLTGLMLLQRKTRLEKLNQLLTPWYQHMSARRTALTAAPRETIEAFNVEAAAYTELRQFTTIEAQAVADWESRVDAEDAAAVDETGEG